MSVKPPSLYPNEDELLSAIDPPVWIDQRFLRQDPFAFASIGVDFHKVACEIASELEVDRNGIFCIGSGAVGLSINPKKVIDGHLKPFDTESDLDLAIISSRHFEQAWRDLLEATQPHLDQRPEELVKNLSWQKKRLFDGAILTNVLLGQLSFGSGWIGRLDKISTTISVALDRNIDVHAWIYRDYWSLRNYIGEGLKKCRTKTLVSTGAGQ